MTSEKTKVIEWLFFNRKYDAESGALTDAIVTMDDVNDGIAATRAKLNPGSNRANFWKDLTRGGAKSLNRNWPAAVFAQGFAAKDAIGYSDGAVLIFVRVAPGQATPFIEDVDDLVFNGQLPVVRLQSLSMPQAMRALGRPSENWHAQVADRLNVVSSFFALCSPRNVCPRTVHEVNFLQTGIKMRGGETDAAFSVLADDGQWLVSAEVKGRTEQFNLRQIVRGARALEKKVRSSTSIDVVGVIPVGIKIVGPSTLWVVEFAPVIDGDDALVKVAEGVFKLIPHVPGVE